MEIPDGLQHKIELFRSSGRVFRYEDELFDISNWVAVFLGQNVIPVQYDPRVDNMSESNLRQMLDGIRSILRGAAEKMPHHEDYLKRHGAWAT
jgi:tryptophan halogenase